jgi:hypothetical protein
MKDQRLAYAMEYRDCGIEEWKKDNVSEKSHFWLHFGQKFSRCRRLVWVGQIRPQVTQKTVKQPMKVMVCGCFSWGGGGGLESLNQSVMMNKEWYLRLLDEMLDLFMGLHNPTHFLQDGTPVARRRL